MSDDDYVELGRLFSPLKADEIVTAAHIDGWGARYSGTMGWDGVLEHRCVVVLAEAGNGKSEEFRAQARKLSTGGKCGFYATIEAIADSDFASALGREAKALDTWRAGRAQGWFFLDSIDEARLNQHSFEGALGKFARELGDGYDRAHILISCRGSEWGGAADLGVIKRLLPPPPPQAASEPAPDSEEALYKPLGRGNREAEQTETKKPTYPDISVMRLIGLTREQRQAFVLSKGVSDVQTFERELDLQRLTELAERPGDLMLLVAYWKEHGKFGSLTDMMERTVRDKLKERQKRRDAGAISEEEARRGAERLAAALTFGQTTSIRIPIDEDVRAGGIDAADVLSDWNADQRKALLTRPLFAPATAGFVRFHHRSAQEYLTASWFRRLMEEGAPQSTVIKICTADVHGVATVPPSLRPAAAWLSQWCPPMREALLEREPLTLLTKGDPAQLTLSEKQRLLREYAKRDADGDLTEQFIDHRALWMFADKDLAPAIREVWAANDDAGFRHDLVRLIAQGQIAACADLAAEYALQGMEGRDYQRVDAVDALAACGDVKRMQAVAKAMLAKPEILAANFAPQASLLLFHNPLSVEDVLLLMARSQPGKKYDSQGFGQVLGEFYRACRTATEREALLAGVAALCFEPPLRDWPTLSLKHAELSRNLRALARAAIIQSDHDGITPGLLRLLMACERANDANELDAEAPLGRYFAGRAALRQQLLWADVEHHGAQNGKPPTSIWDVRAFDAFWLPEEADRAWLEHDLLQRNAPSERSIALSALAYLARSAPDATAALDRLAGLIGSDAALSAELADWRKPRPPSEAMVKHERRMAELDAKRAKEDETVRVGWKGFQQRLSAAPERLSDATVLAEWVGVRDLLDLTRWLRFSTGKDHVNAATHWRRLTAPFGEEVAKHYVLGMRKLWRMTEPQRPKWKGNKSTTPWVVILSCAGIELEASEDASWARKLDADEADRAASHACLSNQVGGDWIGDLLAAHPAVTEARIIEELRREWAKGDDFHGVFLGRAERGLYLTPVIREALLDLIQRRAPKGARGLQQAHALLGQPAFTEHERVQLLETHRRRLSAAIKKCAWPDVSFLLAMLMELRPSEGVKKLVATIEAAKPEERSERARLLLGKLFDLSHAIFRRPDLLSAADLEQLYSLAGETIRGKPEPRAEDEAAEDDDEEDARGRVRDPAEYAQNNLLRRLSAKEGVDAYQRVLKLAEKEPWPWGRQYLRRVARGMIERAAEPAVWQPEAYLAFERKYAGPISTADDLFNAVLGALDDIQFQFDAGDVSSRAVVQSAQSEADVQQWLGEQLILRAKSRFDIHIEKEVAQKKKPDIVAAAARIEVAIEVKHGRKNWTLTALRSALTDQLAKRYLKPANRRRGVLVVSNHAHGYWLDKEGGARLGFTKLIATLQADAHLLLKIPEGDISVAVRGLDAAGPKPTAKPRSVARTKRNAPRKGSPKGS